MTSINLAQAIQIFKSIPEIYFKDFLFDAEVEKQYLDYLNYQFKCHGLWIAYYLLNIQELYFDLQQGNIGLYKPLGERSLKNFNFLQELKLLSQTIANTDINYLWLKIEFEIFLETIDNSGLFGKPLFLGKRSIENKIKIQNELLTDVDKIQIVFKDFIQTSAIQLMIDEAITISKIPENFEFRNKYRNFLSDITKIQSRIRTSKLQTVYLKEGKLILSGDGKRKKKP